MLLVSYGQMARAALGSAELSIIKLDNGLRPGS